MLQKILKNNYLQKNAYYIIRVNKGEEVEAAGGYNRLKANDLVVGRWRVCDSCEGEGGEPVECSGVFDVSVNEIFQYTIHVDDVQAWNLLTKQGGDAIKKLD